MTFAVIGRPDERTAFLIVEAQLITDLSQLGKFVGMYESDDRQMLLRRLQVLSQRDDIYPAVTEITQGLHDFFFRFTQPQHDTALGTHIPFFQGLLRLHAAPVLGLYAHLPRQPFHRLDIMRYDFRSRLDDTGDILLLRLESGDQGLQCRMGIEGLYRPDGILPDDAAAVFQFIPVHRGDDSMLDLHEINGFRHTLGLIPIHGIEPTGGHRTEPTATGADIAEDH